MDRRRTLRGGNDGTRSDELAASSVAVRLHGAPESPPRPHHCVNRSSMQLAMGRLDRRQRVAEPQTWALRVSRRARDTFRDANWCQTVVDVSRPGMSGDFIRWKDEVHVTSVVLLARDP